MRQSFLSKKIQLKHFNEARKRLQGRPSPRREDLRNVTCPACNERVLMADLRAGQYICPLCDATLAMPAHGWLEMLLDEGSFRERHVFMESKDPLAFNGYSDKLQKEQARSGLKDSVVTGSGRIDGVRTAIACMDNRFMMGSMGVVCGEKLTTLIEWATKKQLPLVIVATSGGARMQEGILSLMQMAKTAQALERFHAAGLFYLVILTHPVTGGVMASFASLADVTLAEPDALIGFAGPRVIESTVGEPLPEGFQRAAFQQAHGYVDAVVPRHRLRDEVAFYLTIHSERGGRI